MPPILPMVTALMRSQTLNQTRTKKRPSAKLQRTCTWAAYGWVAFFCGLCGSPRRRSRLLQPPGHSLSWRVRGNFTENAVSKFSVTTPCARPTRVNTERLAERETLLHRLGSKLNRTVLNSCGNSLSVAQTRDFSATRFFCEQSHFHEIDYVWKHQTSNSRLRHSF